MDEERCGRWQVKQVTVRGLSRAVFEGWGSPTTALPRLLLPLTSAQPLGTVLFISFPALPPTICPRLGIRFDGRDTRGMRANRTITNDTTLQPEREPLP